MARMPKLTDIKILRLSTAAQRDDGSLLPPPEQLAEQAARIIKVVPPLLKRAVVGETEVGDVARSWRQDG